MQALFYGMNSWWERGAKRPVNTLDKSGCFPYFYQHVPLFRKFMKNRMHPLSVLSIVPK